MDVLSKCIVTRVTKRPKWGQFPQKKRIWAFANSQIANHSQFYYICESFAILALKMEYKTQTRQMIMDYMAENPDRIFKASELAQSLSEVSLSTIYRNLSRLEKAGMIQIVGAAENNELQYRYTGPGRCEEKMHLVCKECGKFFHLEGPALKVLQLSVQRSGFELDQQQSVLLGRCSGCSRRRHG